MKSRLYFRTSLFVALLGCMTLACGAIFLHPKPTLVPPPDTSSWLISTDEDFDDGDSPFAEEKTSMDIIPTLMDVTRSW
ncbi:MAG: hypothetical protein JXB38_01370 [Anaerolineales bacterium]|nr:hypothetical protein [Anaerolineales bacterium]